MSGFEYGNDQREKAQMMEYHLEKIMLCDWFKTALETYYGNPVNLRDVRYWMGPAGAHFMKPGKTHKYVTAVFRFGPDLLVLEQDGIDVPHGLIRTL